MRMNLRKGYGAIVGTQRSCWKGYGKAPESLIGTSGETGPKWQKEVACSIKEQWKNVLHAAQHVQVR